MKGVEQKYRFQAVIAGPVFATADNRDDAERLALDHLGQMMAEDHGWDEWKPIARLVLTHCDDET